LILTNQDVEEIVAILESTPHDELHLRTERFELHLRRGPGGWTQETRTLRQPHVLDAAAQSAPIAAETLREEGEIAGLASVRAPMVGTFYRAPKPGAPPFVEVGGEVGEFTVVGIIETMKLMNAISAGFAGEVVEILALDGQLVEAGQLLMRVKRPQ
jgi:acetyl-CoA carboxylase biotin carboxyl carrier protein